MNNRKEVTQEEIGVGIGLLTDKLVFRLEEKGRLSLASRHEILGLIKEEEHEFVEAVISGTDKELVDELLDIAVAALFGVICIKANKINW